MKALAVYLKLRLKEKFGSEASSGNHAMCLLLPAGVLEITIIQIEIATSKFS